MKKLTKPSSPLVIELNTQDAILLKELIGNIKNGTLYTMDNTCIWELYTVLNDFLKENEISPEPIFKKSRTFLL